MKRKAGFGVAIILVLAAIAFLLLGGTIAGTDNGEQQGTTLLTDSTGRQVNVPAHPKRVIILNASNVDLYVAAGGGENIVGKAASQTYSDAVKSATVSAQEVGIIHSPNLEAILALQPDLVIGTNVPYHQNLIPTLEKAGIPVYINSLNSFEDIYNTLELYGSLTGGKAAAEARIKQMKAQHDELIANVQGKTPPKSVIIFGNPDSFSMATKKTFTGALVEELGGGNLADTLEKGDAYIPLSMEFLAAQNPDVIFVIMMGNPQAMQEKLQKDLAANPAWSGINAVKNNRVHIMPYNLFTVNPGTQAIAATKTLASYMYP